MPLVTWVKLNEIEEGDWGIGGQTLTAADVHALGKSQPTPVEEPALV